MDQSSLSISGYTIVPELFVGKICCFSAELFYSFKKTISCLYVCGSISSLYSIPLIYLSFLMPTLHCLNYLLLNYDVLKPGTVSPPTLFFSFKVVLKILGFLHLSIDTSISLLIAAKKACWLSDWY